MIFVYVFPQHHFGNYNSHNYHNEMYIHQHFGSDVSVKLYKAKEDETPPFLVVAGGILGCN